MTKLAIAAQTESDQYEHSTFIRCWACDPADGRELPSSVQTTGSVPALVNSVLTATSSARASEVQAWEEEIEACEHTLLLQQSPDPSVLNNGVVGTQCNACDLKENLWLCLTCGSLGCGRKQYGGVAGGNGHGLAHFESTGHPISVKLGTITPEGSAGMLVLFLLFVIAKP
jgi:ubiquitin carboxyl-terminal hydrolase 5/13